MAEDAERWAAPDLPGHDARERAADIPNGELALARFAAWFAGARGTLYVSRSYAAFAAGGARRLLLPLADVRLVRAAPGGRLQRAGVLLRPAAGGEFVFALARREDAPCAVRLLSVLAQRARSGAHLAPLPATASAQIEQAAEHDVRPERGLVFEPRSRHRRRKSRGARRSRGRRQRQRAEEELLELDGHESDVDEAGAADHAERGGARQARVAAPGEEDAGKEVVAAKRVKMAARVREKVGAVAGEIHRQVAKSDIGGWCVSNLFDLALCFVAGLAIVVAVITLRMAETYTLHLRILGISIMSSHV